MNYKEKEKQLFKMHEDMLENKQLQRQLYQQVKDANSKIVTLEKKRSNFIEQLEHQN